MMEPAPYRTEDPTYDRPRAAQPRERTTSLEGFVPIRLVAGILMILFGVLVILEPALLVWVIGFGLVALGIWLLVAGGYLGRPRQETPPRTAEPPVWRP